MPMDNSAPRARVVCKDLPVHRGRRATPELRGLKVRLAPPVLQGQRAIPERPALKVRSVYKARLASDSYPEVFSFSRLAHRPRAVSPKSARLCKILRIYLGVP